MTIKLYDFQEQALKDTEQFKNVLYAYEMGLGKTFIGAEKMHRMNNQVNLIVCQKSKIEDWIDHISSNYDYLTVLDLTKKKNLVSFFDIIGEIQMAGDSDTRICGVINYDLIWRREQLQELKDIMPFTVILDESSLLQNAKSKRTKAVMQLEADSHIMLSGTVVNGAYEKLWSQSRLLGWTNEKSEPVKYREFLDRYCKIYKMQNKHGFGFIDIITGYKNVEELKSNLRKFGAVFKKTDEVIDLPKQNFIFKKVPAMREYQIFNRDKVVEIEGKTLAADFMLTEHIIKRQLAGAYNVHKFKALEDLLDSTSDRLIIFYCYNEELERIIATIGNSRPISIVNGQRRDLVNYENKDNSVTLVQYQAGSMGLNLQKANKIIYFSLPEGGAEMYNQSLKRINRIGQERPCFYYHLITEKTIDEEILEGLNIKADRINDLFKEN